MTEEEKLAIMIKTATQMEEVHKLVVGNGKDGLVNQVNNIEIEITKIKTIGKIGLKLAGVVSFVVSVAVSIVGLFIKK